MLARELYGPRLFGQGYSGQGCFAMVGMAMGGFLGGYLFDISHGYVISWLISFGAGLISVLLAMDLLTQGERAKVDQDAAVPVQARPTIELVFEGLNVSSSQDYKITIRQFSDCITREVSFFTDDFNKSLLLIELFFAGGDEEGCC